MPAPPPKSSGDTRDWVFHNYTYKRFQGMDYKCVFLSINKYVIIICMYLYVFTYI